MWRKKKFNKDVKFVFMYIIHNANTRQSKDEGENVVIKIAV